MPRPTLAELQKTFRLKTSKGAGDHGEDLAARWLISLEVQFARVSQDKYNKSPELVAAGAKRPDLFAQIPGDDKNVIVLDAKHHEPEVLNSYVISEEELLEYLKLLEFLRQKYPHCAFHLIFMYLPKAPNRVSDGEELIWILESDLRRGEECYSYQNKKARRVMLDQLPKDRPAQSPLPALPQPDRSKSAFMDELANLMIKHGNSTNV
jgi:hypothetical protein